VESIINGRFWIRFVVSITIGGIMREMRDTKNRIKKVNVTPIASGRGTFLAVKNETPGLSELMIINAIRSEKRMSRMYQITNPRTGRMTNKTSGCVGMTINVFFPSFIPI